MNSALPLSTSAAKEAGNLAFSKIVASFCNYHPSIGVSDQYDGAVLRRDNARCDAHVIAERNGGILNNTHRKVVSSQQSVDCLPAGSIHEPTVDKNYIPRR